VHEYSIVRALLERVEREVRAQGGTSVGRVCVRIGELSGVEVGLLRTAYLLSREDTLCAQAELDVSVARVEWVCRECGASIDSEARLRCTACGGAATLRAGDEILLERIEMEVADV
jgi:hydrogenase nickel incorporation protein HypA/HybF